MKNKFNSYALSTLAIIGLGKGITGDVLADNVNFADNDGAITSVLEESGVTVIGSNDIFITGGQGLGILGDTTWLDAGESMSFYIDTVTNDVVIDTYQSLDRNNDGININALIAAYNENGIGLGSANINIDHYNPIDISSITGATDIKRFDITMTDDSIVIGSLSFTPVAQEAQLVELTFEGVLDSDPTGGVLLDGDLSYSGSIVYDPQAQATFTSTGGDGTVSSEWDIVSFNLYLAGETIEFPTNDSAAAAAITDSVTNTSDAIFFIADIYSQLQIGTNVLNNLSIRVGSFGLGSAFSGADLSDVSSLYVDGPLFNQDVAISFDMDGTDFDLQDADEHGNNETFISFADYEPVTNEAPTSNAGADQLVIVGDTVILDGSESTDPENDELSYSWTLAVPAGSTSVLMDANTESPGFVPDIVGPYEITLVVSDFFGPGVADSVEILAVSPEQFAEIKIVTAGEIIVALEPGQVTRQGNQNALLNFLSQAANAIQEGDLAEARSKLLHAKIRVDGCVYRGAPDRRGSSRDWITDCEVQAVVVALLNSAREALSP